MYSVLGGSSERVLQHRVVPIHSLTPGRSVPCHDKGWGFPVPGACVATLVASAGRVWEGGTSQQRRRAVLGTSQQLSLHSLGVPSPGLVLEGSHRSVGAGRKGCFCSCHPKQPHGIAFLLTPGEVSHGLGFDGLLGVK